MAGIVIDAVSKTYRGGQVRALDQVSLAIAPGETFGIIGPNGAGKTTLLGCLLGFLRPDAGRVTVDGHAPDDLEVRAGTGYLPERLVMDRWMTGRDFLRYHHELARLPAARREAEVDQILDTVQLDRDAADRAVRKYSRGMLQRLGLAQSLLGEPRYVFLDEPASGVDPAGVLLFRRILADLKSRGATVVLNSHQLEQVERVCDRVAFVNKGHVDAIETLSAGAGLAHGLVVRWATGSQAPTAERLAAAATEAGATLRHHAAGEAHFTVADDAGAARLIRALVSSGVAVVSVVPEEGRLERLFVSGPAAPRGTAR